MTIVDDVIAIRIPKPKFNVLEPIKKRFSPRVFSSEQISEDEMNTVFEAARLAPSAKNLQPWYFYVAYKGTEGYNKLLSCIPDNNKWCACAPVLILACYDPTQPRYDTNPWVLYDLGQAVVSLVLQAQELVIYARQIGIFDLDKAKEIFKIPDPYKAYVTIAIGKMGTEKDYQKANPEIVNKDLTEMKRKETIFEELK
jgi:nitroreductase